MLGRDGRFSFGGGTGRRLVELNERIESLSIGCGGIAISKAGRFAYASGTFGTSGIESSASKVRMNQTRSYEALIVAQKALTIR